MLLTGLIFFVVSFNQYHCFNLDTNFPIVYEDPSKYLFPSLNKSSYFGYSVVLYPGNRSNQPWILIGAPKGYNRNKNFHTGVCFKCGIAETCSSYDIDGLSKSLRSNAEEQIYNFWLGGSMDINYASSRIVTCAPRWTRLKRSRDNKNNDYHMQGACYWFHINDNSTQKLLPLSEPHHDVYTHPASRSSVYYFAQGEAGFSAHMPASKNEIILGAPGVFNWGGIPILYKDEDESVPVASRLQHKNRMRRFADPSEFSYKNIADAIHSTHTLAYDLLGYSTTSGNFYNKSKLLYVSSAPRSDYQGQILIYNFHKNTEKPLVVRESKFGQQFGEYFGGSLAAGDVNGDQLDDLIVGAPFHTTKKYNEGKVYIFLGSKTGRLQTPKRDFIVGKKPNGQFGSTIQYLGDMNHDGFGDVAVAAPYEEEQSGVVYLFRGVHDGLETTYCQRIVGKDIYQSIRGFGISISRPADMDFNGYPDVTIGSYLSGHVVLLRSRPVVTIYQTLDSTFPHLEFSTRNFIVQTCFWFKLDQLYHLDVSIERMLTVDQELGRAFLSSGDYIKVVNIKPGGQICENFTISLTNSFSNRYDPIKISLSHTFQTKKENKEVVYVGSNVVGRDMFCPRCPVYNKYDSNSITTIEIPFALGCKSSNICNASLEFTPKIIDIEEDNTFVLGSKNYITLRTDVKNFGEKAYLTQLAVTVPDIVTFRSTPSVCTEKNASSVYCSVDNPLDTNSQKTITLDLDMTAVNSGRFDDPLVFTLEMITSSENDREKKKQLVVKLKREADLTINGKSEEQSYSYRNVTQGKPNFTQIYQVEKFGYSSLNEIIVEINIPHIFNLDNGEQINFVSIWRPVGTLAGQKVNCYSNFSYLMEAEQMSDVSDSDVTEDVIFVAKEQLKRSVRQVEVFNKSVTVKEKIVKDNEFDAFENRTYHINCSMNQVKCSKVMCTAGPIKSGQIAKFKLKMMFDIAAVKEFLGKKDVVLFATQGHVSVTNPKNFVESGDRPNTVEVASLFVGDSETEVVELWIVIVSVVSGLLLLLLLILGLIKAGFFKREAKEELEQLKREMAYMEGETLAESSQE